MSQETTDEILDPMVKELKARMTLAQMANVIACLTSILAVSKMAKLCLFIFEKVDGIKEWNEAMTAGSEAYKRKQQEKKELN